MCPGVKGCTKMTDYHELFNNSWRGWFDGRGEMSYTNRLYITSSRATSYNGLLHEMIAVKRQELNGAGGNPFYEPTTFYRSISQAHYHNNVEMAAGRLATDIFSHYSRYRAHKCHDIRVLPEERDEYGLRIWRISHPEPLTGPQRQLWMTINEVAATEPWAWPMMIGLEEKYYTSKSIQSFPVLTDIMKKFLGLGYTEEKFLEVQKELWQILKWESAKGM